MADLYGSQDVTIRNDDGSKIVTITTEASKQRLDVDANSPYPGKGFTAFLLNGASSAQNVNGSVTPVSFQNGPASGKIWYVVSFSVTMEDTSMNFSKFGGITALTNGWLVKVKENGGSEITVATIKKNGDFYTYANNVIIESSTTDILIVQFNPVFNTGATIKLLYGDYLKTTVNDDLSSLDSFSMLIRGYEVDA